MSSTTGSTAGSPGASPDTASTVTATAGVLHPRHLLDEVIHSPVRLSVVSALSGVDRAEFAEVRDTVQVSDSVLSKQVASLEAAGYVEVTKGRVGRRPRTWLALTSEGRAALRSHLAALRALLGAELR